MPIFRRLLLAVLLVSSFGPAMAQTSQANPGDELHKAPVRQGWFWYQDPAEKKKPVEDDVPLVIKAPEAPKEKGPVVVVTGGKDVDPEKKCGAKDTWDASCGFIDPGDDFEFQAKQRDILLQQMSLRPDVPEAVEAAQRYMKWVVGKASAAANMWYFNMVQNPDLDPTVKNPVSEVGIALASRAREATQAEYFRIMREEGGVLFFFSRTDCQFCHEQAPYARRVAHNIGLRLINVPLDGKCIEGFEGDDCADNIKPEQTAVLQVRVVPALFLFVPANTWIRLGTGIVTDATVMANAVNFFSAYRAAMLQGLDNSRGARPSVSFNPEVTGGKATGVVNADGSQAPALPDRARLMEMLGYGKAAK